MKRYIKSTQSIFAGYSCNGWFNILKNQKIPVSRYDDLDYDESQAIDHFDDDEWTWGPGTSNRSNPDYVEEGYESIIKYTDGWYKDINNYLRGKPYSKDPGWGKLTPRQRSNRIHKVISQVGLPKDIVTVRWANLDSITAYLGKDAIKDIIDGDVEKYIGKIVKEKGFYSSSMSGRLRQPYYDSKPVQFITLLPKGTPAIYIWDHVARHGSEYEILLMNGSSFIVRDIQYSGVGFDASSGLHSDANFRIFMEKI